jgi:hypothetical protein
MLTPLLEPQIPGMGRLMGKKRVKPKAGLATRRPSRTSCVGSCVRHACCASSRCAPLAYSCHVALFCIAIHRLQACTLSCAHAMVPCVRSMGPAIELLELLKNVTMAQMWLPLANGSMQRLKRS